MFRRRPKKDVDIGIDMKQKDDILAYETGYGSGYGNGYETFLLVLRHL